MAMIGSRVSRRQFCLAALAARALAQTGAQTDAQSDTDEISGAQRAALTSMANAFMRDCAVPGLSVAIAKHGKSSYRQAFGLADTKKMEPVAPSSLFRIASVSKPFTSAAIFTLIEQGKLALDTRVFGPDALLGTAYGKPPYNPGVDRITIEHLLTHTSGGWPKGADDPMFLHQEADHKALISAVLKNRPLDFAPGMHYAYSNFGFCVLGRVIERVSGMGYADYVRRYILQVCGIEGMHIAGNGGKRSPDEVRYYDQEGRDPYYINVSRLDAAGGWLATPGDIVQFATRVDGFPTDANILKQDTITMMTTGSEANPHYAKGWEVNGRGTWWHIGDLPGSSAVVMRTPAGYCGAACMNTRRMQPDIRIKLEHMVRDMIRGITV
jgi:CubicO group peptidase (beta-lactamase class C family)